MSRGRRPQVAIVGTRSRELGGKQGFNDLRVIWSAVKREANGGEPLKPEVREKILESLFKTVQEPGLNRARLLASSILLALADNDFERDVYRNPVQRSRKHRRAAK